MHVSGSMCWMKCGYLMMIIIQQLVMADNPPYRFLQTGERSNNLSELKQNLLDKYFITQHQFDEQFVGMIFSVGEHDPQVDGIIQQQSLTILHSKQKAAIHFLENLITRAQYHHLAHQFLLNLIELKTTTCNQPLLHYVVSHLPKLLTFLNKNNPEFIHALITFLALKMRSFDLQTRITSLQALKQLGGIVEEVKGEWQKTMRRVVPLMIEKQQLVKEVSYIKGLFLQMLEDEFHEVRILSIECLGIYRNYMRSEDLKQIIIYMLNDQHQLVREQALQTAKSFKNLPLAKEDLETLLMCLKEKRTNLRRLVYQNLEIISINDVSLLLLLLDKILIALQIYRSDKKQIYSALFELGCRYYLEIGKIFVNLGLNDMEQPNCKNISYKAKMVLCHRWWKSRTFQRDSLTLPSYFTKHMLYITDVEAYLFESNNGSIQEEVESSIDFNGLLNNFHHLIRFIECEEEISQEFHKTLLEVAREWIINQTEIQVLNKKIKMLSISFKLGAAEVDLKKNLYQLIQEGTKQHDRILQVIQLIIANREDAELGNTVITYNKCTISRLEPNLVVSSKCSQFIDNVHLKCWKNIMISKQRKIEYKKLKDLEFLNENEESCFWRANLSKYSQIQCVLVLPNAEERVLDSYDFDQK